MFDFSASGQVSELRRRPLLPLIASIAIHTAAVMLVLTLTFSDGLIERPKSPRAMILLVPAPVVHAAPSAFIAAPHAVLHTAPHTAQAADRIAPRLFRAPVAPFSSAPLHESTSVPDFPIPLPEVFQPLLAPEVAHLSVAPAPPLRTDNFGSLAARASLPASAAKIVSGSSGFEQIEIETPLHQRAPARLGGEFDDATLVPAVQPRRAVEILSKPRPAYTDEARRQRIEGEVLLEVLFAASGQVRVLRVVRGLGDGLDETAIAAAEAIRFRPAERAGVAADSTAIVHIVFQLAY